MKYNVGTMTSLQGNNMRNENICDQNTQQIINENIFVSDNIKKIILRFRCLIFSLLPVFSFQWKFQS